MGFVRTENRLSDSGKYWIEFFFHIFMCYSLKLQLTIHIIQYNSNLNYSKTIQSFFKDKRIISNLLIHSGSGWWFILPTSIKGKKNKKNKNKRGHSHRMCCFSIVFPSKHGLDRYFWLMHSHLVSFTAPCTMVWKSDNPS